jgi:CubicO group peptidase (beta-lactamase class C family)
MRPLAVIAAFLLSFSLSAQKSNEFDPKAVDKLISSTMKTWQLPGVAVAVVKGDRVVYVQGYGTKEAGGSEVVTADTLFQIASTTKAFTTTAISMLAADGKLSWDDPVKKHLPYFSLGDMCVDSQVTLRDITSHRTGSGRYDELWDNSPYSREQVVRALGENELVRPFRTGYGYNNILFIAAGEVVANASGMSWDEFVKQRIFVPLGMTRTTTSDEEWLKSDHASGYRYDWRTNRVVPQQSGETQVLAGAGAIKSSARDMANWMRFQLANGAFNLHQLIDPALIEETRMPHTVIRVENTTRDLNPETHVMSYGLGWVIQDYRGEHLVSHTGGLNGFRTQLNLLPKRNSGFIIMANAGRGYALVAMRNALADMLSGKPSRDWNAYYLMLEHRANQKEAREREERLAKRIAGTTPTLPLAQYAGEYESRSHGKATIAVVDDKLVLQWSRATIPLAHFHYDVFTVYSEADYVDEELAFTLDSRREVQSFSLFGTTFVKRAAPPRR